MCVSFCPDVQWAIGSEPISRPRKMRSGVDYRADERFVCIPQNAAQPLSALIKKCAPIGTGAEEVEGVRRRERRLDSTPTRREGRRLSDSASPETRDGIQGSIRGIEQ